MSARPFIAQISADAELRELRGAFTRANVARATEVVLTLAFDRRPTASFAEDVVKAATACPGLRRLTLVHPSASVGFVASSLQLRMSEVAVRARRTLEHDSRPPAETSEQRSDRRHAEREAHRSGSHVRPGVASVPIGADEATVRAALMRFTRTTQCVLILEGRGRPERDLVKWISSTLRGMPGATELAVVHDSPAIGFLTSSLSLQLPAIRVHALRTLEELDAVV